MDDFSMLGKFFDNCLENLRHALIRCEETNLVLNWKKRHFMLKEVIVLGDQISERGIEVDKARIETIEKLPPPSSMKGIRSFLGHKGFLQNSQTLIEPGVQGEPFEFDDQCMQALVSEREIGINTYCSSTGLESSF